MVDAFRFQKLLPFELDGRQHHMSPYERDADPDARHPWVVVERVLAIAEEALPGEIEVWTTAEYPLQRIRNIRVAPPLPLPKLNRVEVEMRNTLSFPASINKPVFRGCVDRGGQGGSAQRP